LNVRNGRCVCWTIVGMGPVCKGSRRARNTGVRTVGYECSVGVENLTVTLDAVREAGGKVVMGPVTISTVGDLAFVEDTEGNVVGVMQYAG
jgi:predicted enzyme related to lactoylglutathione lyase